MNGKLHLADLDTMSRAELGARWQEVFGSPAPIACRSGLLRLALGWQMQMVALKPALADPKRLVAYLRSARAPSRRALLPGTRLLREWQGRTHEVTVLADGFLYGGKVHKSLSAIARQITGTAWSGPVFFGLRN